MTYPVASNLACGLALASFLLSPSLLAGGDGAPPTVLQTSTVAGPLEECEAVRQTVFSTRFNFSEAMQNPDGDTATVDATNPQSYLLVMPGEDGDIQTTSCAGGGSPLDEVITIDFVFYNADTDTYFAANFNRLIDGQYRLFACAAGIQDMAGNPLDGDGDGTGGDDFQIVFRVDQFNQVRNGHFDCDLRDWVFDDPGFELDLLVDAGGSALSGSVGLAAPPQSRSRLGQCVQVGPNGQSLLFGQVRTEATLGALVSYTQGCTFYELPGCQGEVVGQIADTYDLLDSGGQWVPLLGELLQVPDALSARCRFTFDDLGGLQAVSADDFFFDGGASIITEGMESGSLVPWPERRP